MLQCLWNNPQALREEAKRLSSTGFDQAAQGCLERAERVESLLPVIEKDPRKTYLLRERVEM